MARKNTSWTPPTAHLLGARGHLPIRQGSEIKLKDLSPEERKKFEASMAKEWCSWEKFNAVDVLTPDQVAQIPGDVRIIGTRWVHTDKNQKQRLLALHVRGKAGKAESRF